MKQSTSNTLWLVIGASLFYFLLNAISAAQGWPFKLPGISFEKFDRYAVALVATPIGLIGVAVLLGIGIVHGRASTRTEVRRRLPIPFKLGDPDSVFLHICQIVAFVGLPLLALASLTAKYFKGDFCREAAQGTACGLNGYMRVGDRWDHFAYVAPGEAFASRHFIYQGGPDYWPFWTPIGVLLLWALVLCMLAAFAWNVLKVKIAR